MGYSKAKKQRIFERYNGCCVYCGVELNLDHYFEDDAYEIDHFIPKSQGGTSIGDANFVASCKKCNRNKHSMTVEQWLEKKKKKLDRLRFQIKELENSICLIEEFKNERASND